MADENKKEGKLEKDANEIEFYHGSLEELNSRDPNKQYKFAEESHFVSQIYPTVEGFIKEIKEHGWDGLVNKRIYVIPLSIGGLYPTQSSLGKGVEGTPILRVKKQ